MIDKQAWLCLSSLLLIIDQLCFGTIDWSGWTEERSSRTVHTWDETFSMEVMFGWTNVVSYHFWFFFLLSFTKLVSFVDLLCRYDTVTLRLCLWKAFFSYVLWALNFQRMWLYLKNYLMNKCGLIRNYTI